MKPVAINSDIHANLPALTVVQENIDKQGIGELVCLGDFVGYGEQPHFVKGSSPVKTGSSSTNGPKFLS